jgi:hypothetical protein
MNVNENLTIPEIYKVHQKYINEFIQSMLFEGNLPNEVNNITGSNGSIKSDSKIDEEVHSFARQLSNRSPQATLVIDQAIREVVIQHGYSNSSTHTVLSALIPNLIQTLAEHRYSNFKLKLHSHLEFQRHWETVLLKCLNIMDIRPVSTNEGPYAQLIRYLIKETRISLKAETVIRNIYEQSKQS